MPRSFVALKPPTEVVLGHEADEHVGLLLPVFIIDAHVRGLQPSERAAPFMIYASRPQMRLSSCGVSYGTSVKMPKAAT